MNWTPDSVAGDVGLFYPMDWFYAEGNDRKGPVSDQELSGLIVAGKITASTLVWNSTFTQWRSAESCGLIPPTLPVSPGSHVCVVSGKIFPESQMLQTEHGWVSAESRDIYYQCLREGVPFSAVTGRHNARVDGARIVVPVKEARLPLRCVKTGQPAEPSEAKPKTLWWCPPLVFLTILLSVIVLLVVYFVTRKSVKLEIPLSRDGRRLVRQNILIACGAALAGLTLMVVGGVYVDTLAVLIFVGLMAVLFSLFWAAIKGSPLRIVKIKDGEAWLAGASPAFLTQLPPYR